jgi:hypothetical protein
MITHIIDYLLSSNEPWTRYRTLLDLCDLPEQDKEVQVARQALLEHPLVISLMEESRKLLTPPIKRHNDASHPLYKLSTLAEFGIKASHPGMALLLNEIRTHQTSEGILRSLVQVPRAFGGSGEDQWSWMMCDTPTLLYVMLKMGMNEKTRFERALQHIVDLADENGWRCKVAPELGKFRGPGRKDDPCPIANLLALKALTLVPEWSGSSAVATGVEMLLNHWQHRKEKKYYLFGMGTDFRKLKYPFIWYDILHVVEVLSQLGFARQDLRFQEMLVEITNQADENGRFTPGSMYQSWKGWSFADKKYPSPWLTFLVTHIQKRCSPE